MHLPGCVDTYWHFPACTYIIIIADGQAITLQQRTYFFDQGAWAGVFKGVEQFQTARESGET